MQDTYINNHYHNHCGHDGGHAGVRMVPNLSAFCDADTNTPLGVSSTRMGDVIMGFELPDSQKTTISVKFKGKKGQDAKVDGIPEWSTDNSELLALTPAADGMSCDVTAVGPLGSATVTLKADARMGVDVVDIVGTLEIEVTAGEATTVELTPSAPVDA